MSQDNEDHKRGISDTDEEREIEEGTTQSYKTSDLGTTVSHTPVTPDYFDAFKQTVFSARPSIGTIYHEHKNTPFFTYSKNHARENRNKSIKKRKQELATTLYEQVRRVLGSAIADSVVKQLKTNDSVSTVQKHTPLGHPDTLNATLMNALPYFGNAQPSFRNVIVLACAGISFNNTKFPRGHLFHSISAHEIVTNLLTFFGHTVDSRPVMFFPSYTGKDLTDAKNALMQLQRDGQITGELLHKITAVLDDIYASPHALSATDYVDQVTITNYYVFKSLFGTMTKYVPSLVFLSQEKLALALLLEHHLDKPTTLHRILFDYKVAPLVEQYFDGLTGAFVKEQHIGSYLFWGIPKNGKYRTQLWRVGNALVSSDGNVRIELTPERIRQAIERREIIPSILLTFLTIAMYYGLILGGGYEQTFYLTRIKEQYLAFLREIGESESEQAAADLTTTNLVIPRPLLTYIDDRKGARIPATTLDMLLYTDAKKQWYRMLEASKKVTLGQIIERTLPSIYREYAMNKPGADQFADLSERDVETYNGMDQIIQPVITL